MKHIIVVLYLAFNLCSTQEMKINESTITRDEVPVKIVKQQVGADVHLKCRDHDRLLHNYAHKWKFSHCENCDKLKADEMKWRDIQQLHRLHLRNVTTADAGRYFCIVHDVIVAAYQLEIVAAAEVAATTASAKRPHLIFDTPLKFRARPPSIVDVDAPDTVHAFDNVAVKCRVSSPLAPRIWWLKQCDGRSNCVLRHDSNFYRKINDTHQDLLQHVVEDNIYVSKLHLNNFTRDDDGVYVCVTITELGKDFRNFTLRALPPADEDAPPAASSLNFLFLIPFLFILALICIDCVLKRVNKAKRCKQEFALMEIARNKAIATKSLLA